MREESDVKTVLQHVLWALDLDLEAGLSVLADAARQPPLPVDSVLKAIGGAKCSLEATWRYLKWVVENLEEDDLDGHKCAEGATSSPQRIGKRGGSSKTSAGRQEASGKQGVSRGQEGWGGQQAGDGHKAEAALGRSGGGKSSLAELHTRFALALADAAVSSGSAFSATAHAHAPSTWAREHRLHDVEELKVPLALAESGDEETWQWDQNGAGVEGTGLGTGPRKSRTGRVPPPVWVSSTGWEVQRPLGTETVALLAEGDKCAGSGGDGSKASPAGSAKQSSQQRGQGGSKSGQLAEQRLGNDAASIKGDPRASDEAVFSSRHVDGAGGAASEARDTLRWFLLGSERYDATRVWERVKGAPHMAREKVVLLQRLGWHAEALRILALEIGDHEAAEEYCKHTGTDSSFSVLLDLYLDPGAPAPPMLDAAVQLMHCHAASLDPLRILEVLGDSTPPHGKVFEVVSQLLGERQHRLRQGQVARQLAKAESRRTRIALVQRQQASVAFGATGRHCDACGRALEPQEGESPRDSEEDGGEEGGEGTGGRVKRLEVQMAASQSSGGERWTRFAVYPNGVVACMQCYRESGPHRCPVTHANFKPSLSYSPTL